ncbi:transposase, MuDR, MULE transposase domain protein [Tanacetum coccineum]|uniref:Transposase, MuDR, MULE transposase domain protein n=1 Tax=Tanacetum coccineum TaxID=301880 RepID=A0ABQ5G115_9ASTR
MQLYYCYNLERKNQGSVTRIKTDDKGVFEMLFIALGASIRTFLNYLRPLLIIDAAHLKGEYKGTNLVDVGMDGNNQIVPVAFGICKGETGPCWSWWMSVLKECIGDHNNLLFISDRHPAIALAVHNEFPLAFHVTYTPDEFTVNMNIMQAVQPDAYQKLCQARTQQWSRAHCPLVRYNYMMSNSVEFVNACSVINRKLLVLKLAETYRAMLQDRYFERQKLTANMKYETTDWVADKVHKRKLKNATWIVHEVNQYVYQVLDGRYNRQVNLETGVCECQKYQGTYAESIHFLGYIQEWEFPSHIHPAIPPRMDDPQPEVDGAFVTSWRMLFVIPSTNVVKLIGFTNDDGPIVEVDRGRMLHPLQVYDRTSQEFHNVGIFADGDLAQMMNHVITDYTSDSEEERKEVTQNDYTYDQMIEWANKEHFEDEETKEVHYQAIDVDACFEGTNLALDASLCDKFTGSMPLLGKEVGIGQYVRRDHGSNPFILLEAVASQDFWIWHAFFGVVGSKNDINVLYQSLLFHDLKTGRAPEIPFVANGVSYPSGYYLVDGIYPELAPLVKMIAEQADDNHKRILYKQKQESARKDVERAFGVLKKK